MFFRGINEFESKFKLFDRLNSLLFNVWRGKAAETYKNGDIARITNEWRNYSSQVRSLAEEANRLNSELDQKLEKITRLNREINAIASNPQIYDCSIWEAIGEEAIYDDEGNVRYYQECAHERYVAKGVRVHNEKEIAAQYVGDCDNIRVQLIKNL